MRISDWSSDVCSSDLLIEGRWNPEDPRDAIDREIGWSNIERSVRETELLTAGSEDGLEDVLQRYPSVRRFAHPQRSEEHPSELQSLMRTSYAVFCLKKKNTTHRRPNRVSTTPNLKLIVYH